METGIWIDIAQSKGFLKRQSPFILFCLVISCLAFGFEVSNVTISIDEERSFLLTSTHPGWIAADRWGMTLINAILQPGPSVPYYPLVLAICFNILTFLLALELWNAYKGVGKYLAAIMALTLPSIAFVYQFHVASYGYYFGQFISVLGVFIYMRRGGFWGSMASILLFTFAMATYQATIFAAPVVFFISQFIAAGKQNQEIEVDQAKSLKKIGIFIFCLAVSVVLNQGISNIVRNQMGVASRYHTVRDFFNGSFIADYDLVFTIKELVALIIGHKIYIGWPAGIAVVLSIGTLILYVYRLAIGQQRRLLQISMLILAIASPFLLIIVTGHIWPARALMAIPLLYSGLLFLAFVKGNQLIKYLLIIAGLVIFIHNLQLNTRLFYSDYITWQNDKLLAQRITQHIEQQIGDSLLIVPIPLVIIGIPQRKLLPGQMQVETFGRSLFEWDSGSHHRIIPIFQLTGIDYFREPNRLEIEKGYSWSHRLNNWPSKNSTKIDAGMIILKFSEPAKDQLHRNSIK